jgi:hypothetical protein
MHQGGESPPTNRALGNGAGTRRARPPEYPRILGGLSAVLARGGAGAVKVEVCRQVAKVRAQQNREAQR